MKGTNPLQLNKLQEIEQQKKQAEKFKKTKEDIDKILERDEAMIDLFFQYTPQGIFPGIRLVPHIEVVKKDK